MNCVLFQRDYLTNIEFNNGQNYLLIGHTSIEKMIKRAKRFEIILARLLQSIVK